MNTRISTARREEGGVTNERIPPRVDQVPIVGLEGESLEGENEEVPLKYLKSLKWP